MDEARLVAARHQRPTRPLPRPRIDGSARAAPSRLPGAGLGRDARPICTGRRRNARPICAGAGPGRASRALASTASVLRPGGVPSARARNAASTRASAVVKRAPGAGISTRGRKGRSAHSAARAPVTAVTSAPRTAETSPTHTRPRCCHVQRSSICTRSFGPLPSPAASPSGVRGGDASRGGGGALRTACAGGTPRSGASTRRAAAAVCSSSVCPPRGLRATARPPPRAAAAPPPAREPPRSSFGARVGRIRQRAPSADRRIASGGVGGEVASSARSSAPAPGAAPPSPPGDTGSAAKRA